LALGSAVVESKRLAWSEVLLLKITKDLFFFYTDWPDT
jgi:hypothetical protein